MSTLTQQERSPEVRRVEFVTPRANLHHDGDSYTLEIEMPGVGKEGVEVTVDDGKLTLTGHRTDGETPGRAVYSERGQASYRRVFDLDPSIDAAKITAGIEQGLLTVRLVKAEAAKPRKIKVS
jgi:HSP20 family protein